MRALRWPFYLYLIAVLPAVHFYEVNFRLLNADHLVRPILLSFVLVGVLHFSSRFIWRPIEVGALVLAPLVIVFFKGNDIGPWGSLALLALAIGLGFFFAKRDQPWVSGLSLPLNVVLLILVILPVFTALQASSRESPPSPSAFFATEIDLPQANHLRRQPDVYYLMVDGLGQPAFVETLFPIDRAHYSGPLRNRGFQILEASFANYPQTALSSAATLNLGTLDQVLDIPDAEARDRRPLAEVVGRSRVARAFKSLGYRIVDFPSGYPLTEQLLATTSRTPFIDPTFVEYYLIEDGVLALVQSLFAAGPAELSFAMRRNRLNYIFDHLGAVTENIPDDEPVFVYAHILAPHPPFVFGADGEALTSRAKFAFADGNHWLDIHGHDDQSYRQRYADQAAWIMKRLADAVDEIVSSSARPKIIIIQGDHGPGSGLRWNSPLDTDHNERFGIFNGWYVSTGREVPLYDGMTSLNTFPVLFNTFFNAQLPLLPDKHWFARMREPYLYFEVEK